MPQKSMDLVREHELRIVDTLRTQRLGKPNGFGERDIVVVIAMNQQNGERQPPTALMGEAASAVLSTSGGVSST